MKNNADEVKSVNSIKKLEIGSLIELTLFNVINNNKLTAFYVQSSKYTTGLIKIAANYPLIYLGHYYVSHPHYVSHYPMFNSGDNIYFVFYTFDFEVITISVKYNQKCKIKIL